MALQKSEDNCVTHPDNCMDFVKVVNKVSSESKTFSVWVWDVEKACANANLIFGWKITDNPETKLRRLHSIIGKGKRIVTRNLEKNGETEEAAKATVASYKVFKTKIKDAEEMNTPVNDFLAGLQLLE